MNKPAGKSDPIFKAARKQVSKVLAPLTPGEAPDAEAIHAIRVCSKKLRALLQLYRPGNAKADIKQVEQLLKQLANSYAGLRDSHVQEKTLGRLVSNLPADDQAPMQPLFDYFAQANHQANEQINPIDAHTGFAEVLEQWAELLRLQHRSDPAKGLDYSYRRARKLALEAHQTGEDDTYHQCRKWTKYYLYQAQLLCDRKAAKASIKALKQLGELLGQFQDHCVLEDSLLNGTLAACELEAASQQALQAIEQQKSHDKEKARQLFEQLYQQPHVPLKC